MSGLMVDDVHFAYGGARALAGVSLQVQPAEVVALIGSNGAGKTTTAKVIAGALAPSAGSVAFEGHDVSGLPAHRVVRRGIVLVPEGRQVFAQMTIQENLLMGAYKERRRSRVQALLEQSYETFPRLRERRSQIAGSLSGGEQQMLAFGRSLMSQPDYILMDEPSMGLAPAVVDRVMASVRTIADRGIGVLMVEQNAEAGMRIADDVVVVNRGESVYSGPVDEARNHSSVVLAFLGEAALTGTDN